MISRPSINLLFAKESHVVLEIRLNKKSDNSVALQCNDAYQFILELYVLILPWKLLFFIFHLKYVYYFKDLDTLQLYVECFKKRY